MNISGIGLFGDKEEKLVTLDESDSIKTYVDNTSQKEDVVNKPKHYTRDGGMECWDEMELVFGTEATAQFCLLSSWKYRYRAADKNGMEDLKKSDRMMKKYKELVDKLENGGARV